jgi:hypothetical protein
MAKCFEHVQAEVVLFDYGQCGDQSVEVAQQPRMGAVLHARDESRATTQKATGEAKNGRSGECNIEIKLIFILFFRRCR